MFPDIQATIRQLSTTKTTVTAIVRTTKTTFVAIVMVMGNKAFGFKCNFAIRLSSKKNTDNFFNSKDATNSVNFNSKP